jgi:hypothetical protein
VLRRRWLRLLTCPCLIPTQTLDSALEWLALVAQMFAECGLPLLAAVGNKADTPALQADAAAAPSLTADGASGSSSSSIHTPECLRCGRGRSGTSARRALTCGGRLPTECSCPPPPTHTGFACRRRPAGRWWRCGMPLQRAWPDSPCARQQTQQQQRRRPSSSTPTTRRPQPEPHSSQPRITCLWAVGGVVQPWGGCGGKLGFFAWEFLGSLARRADD